MTHEEMLKLYDQITINGEAEPTNRVLNDDTGNMEWVAYGKFRGTEYAIYFMTTPQDEASGSEYNDWTDNVDWRDRVDRIEEIITADQIQDDEPNSWYEEYINDEKIKSAEIAARVKAFEAMVQAGGGLGVARVRHKSWDNQPADDPIGPVIVLKIDAVRGGFLSCPVDDRNETSWDECDDSWYLHKS